MAATSVVVLDRGNNTTCTINLYGKCLPSSLRRGVTIRRLLQMKIYCFFFAIKFHIFIHCGCVNKFLFILRLINWKYRVDAMMNRKYFAQYLRLCFDYIVFHMYYTYLLFMFVAMTLAFTCAILPNILMQYFIFKDSLCLHHHHYKSGANNTHGVREICILGYVIINILKRLPALKSLLRWKC